MNADRARWPKGSAAITGEHAERGVTLVEVVIFMAVFTVILLGMYDAHVNYQFSMVRNEARAKIQDDARRTMEQMLREIRMAGYGVPTAADPTPLPAFTAASASAISFLTSEGGATTNLTAPANVTATTLTVASSALFQTNDGIYVSDAAKYRAATVTATGGNSLTITPALTAGFASGATVTRQPRQVTYSYNAGTLSRDLGTGGGLQPLVTGISSLAFSYFDANNNPVGLPGGNLAAIRRVLVDMTVSATPPGQPSLAYTARSDIRVRNR